jgi:hypothetical protein
LDGPDFGLQILEVLFQPGQALLARVEAAGEMSALLPLATTALVTAVMLPTVIVAALAVVSAATIAMAAVVETVMMSVSFVTTHR